MTTSPIVLGGRYQLETIIGQGGMAEVWRAHDLRLDRNVAIKRLRADLASDPTFQARFQREAQSAASLNHPNIVAVYDTGSQTDPETGANRPYIVMELVTGHTLREKLQNGPDISPEEALEYTAGILDALTFSHGHGIIHRDIKPANVMITPAGEVKVMDFGIARAVADTSATMTQTASVIGTAQYLSPEQARGETVDSRSDIYSAGCLLYELLTGRPPFIGDSPVAVAYQHVRENPAPPSQINPDISPSIDSIVLRALVKDPNQRYQNAREMNADIGRALHGQEIAALASANVTTTLPAQHVPTRATTGVWQPAVMPPKKKRRLSTPTIVLIVLLVALLTALGIVYFRFAHANREPQTTTVPAVLGFTEDQAVSTLKNAKLSAAVQHAAGPQNTKGQVISTNPAAEATVKISSTVTITVNDGPASTALPDVTGKAEDAARSALASAGFTNVVTKDASQAQEGTQATANNIVATDPVAGAKIDPGAQVTLYRATGRSPMPDVSSQHYTVNQALNLLKQAGFPNVDATPTSSYPTGTPAGTVVFQSPLAGTLFGRSDRVAIQFAQPSQTQSPTPAQTNSPNR